MIISIYKSCEGHQALQRVGAVDSSDFLHDREAGRMSNQVEYRGVGAMDSSECLQLQRARALKTTQQYSKELVLSHVESKSTFHFTFDVWQFPIHKFIMNNVWRFPYTNLAMNICIGLHTNPRLNIFSSCIVMWD